MPDSSTGKKKTTFLGVAMLLLTAAIWGSAFIAQSEGMKNVETFTFTASRSVLGSLFLLPIIIVRDFISIRKNGKKEKTARNKSIKKTILFGSILGVIFTIAANLQQYAFNYSTPGKIAFITAFYMFFVPVIGIFTGKKIKPAIWVCVALGIVGMFFLCIDPSEFGAINFGDILALLCAITYAFHITFIEKYGPEIDPVKMSCIQFVVAAILSGIVMFIFEKPSMDAIVSAGVPILYAGIASCGIAYTLQIIGQQRTEATVASIIMCLESVFAVICEVLILGTFMKPREILGCSIMLVAIILSQLAESSWFRKGKK